jgi:hypothetical protein
MAGRIQQYLEKLMRSKAEILDEASRKRAADQAAVNAGDAKRQKVEGGARPFSIPPLGPGPHTLAGVFTLTDNAGLQAFDASLLPANLAAKISVKTLANLDQHVLDFAMGVSGRHRRYEGGCENTDTARESGIAWLISTLQGRQSRQQRILQSSMLQRPH